MRDLHRPDCDTGIGTPSPDEDVGLLGYCLGEHHVFDTWNSYRAGDHLHLHLPGPHPPSVRQIPAPLLRYLRTEGVASLYCWGTNPLGLRSALPEFAPVGLRIEDRWNRLLRIRFDRYRPDLKQRHWQRARAFAERGFRLEPGSVGAFPNYLRLLQPVIPRIPEGLQRGIYESFAALAASAPTIILEIRAGDAVMGVLGIRNILPGYGYTCWSAVDRAIPHLTDFLFAETLTRMSQHLVILDLGYGVNEGIFNYKAKWQPTAVMKPRFHVHYKREA